MTIQTYLIVENNIVTNSCLWDGDTNTWHPPADATVLVDDETLGRIWQANDDKTEWVLKGILGAGAIGFTWDGLALTTPDPKPTLPPI